MPSRRSSPSLFDIPEVTSGAEDLLTPPPEPARFAVPEVTSAAPDLLTQPPEPVRFVMSSEPDAPRLGRFECVPETDGGEALQLAPQNKVEVFKHRPRPMVRPAPEGQPSAMIAAVLDTSATLRATTLGILGLPVAALVALLPERWRNAITRRIELPMKLGGFVSGLGQGLAGILLLHASYEPYLRSIGRIAGEIVNAAAYDPNRAKALVYNEPVVGVAALVGFLFTPAGFAGIAMVVEGTIRGFTTLASGHVVGTLPLGLIERFLALVNGGAARFRPTVADEIIGPGRGWELRVASAQPKDWDALTTVAWRGEHYRLLRADVASGNKRSHVYLLRKAGAHDLLRRLVDLDGAADSRT